MPDLDSFRLFWKKLPHIQVQCIIPLTDEYVSAFPQSFISVCISVGSSEGWLMISCLRIHRNNKHRYFAVWFGLRFEHVVLWVSGYLGLLAPGHQESVQTAVLSSTRVL